MSQRFSGGSAPGWGAAAVAAVVVGVVAMLIVPLPPWLLDGLITFNLALSVTLLLAVVYAHNALAIASFPTLLVLTTLFRLGLNVSTTRLILLQAHTGRVPSVVRAFGSVVVGDEYIVGGAVFLILTIVQYLVISRGAERVAEVAARFTLDAMPGKQLAIDAELRAQTLDADGARHRRNTLQREAQLYGALDGAMRFVKGDAIAGILILIIAMVGGLLIGVLRHDLPIATAAKTYLLVTIGDGLVSQLPALVLSTAAGLVVTRVAAEEGEGPLGNEILRQVAARPVTLAIVAGLLLLLALVPGLPLVPFLIVGALFGGAAGAAYRQSRPLAVAPPSTADIAVRIALPLGGLLNGRELRSVSERVAHDLGISLESGLQSIEPTLADQQFEIRLRGHTVARGEAESRAALLEAIEVTLRRHAHELVGIDETQRLVDQLAPRCPALVRAAVPAKIDLVLLSQVLRYLLAEGVPIGDLREILEAIAAMREVERDPIVLTERVRGELKRHITHRLAKDRRVEALLLDPLVEEAVRDAVRPSGELALEPALADDILAAVQREVAARSAALVIITSAELRRHVRRLIEEDYPDLAVVTYHELESDVQIDPVGRIAVTSAAS